MAIHDRHGSLRTCSHTHAQTFRHTDKHTHRHTQTQHTSDAHNTQVTRIPPLRLNSASAGNRPSPSRRCTESSWTTRRSSLAFDSRSRHSQPCDSTSRRLFRPGRLSSTAEGEGASSPCPRSIRKSYCGSKLLPRISSAFSGALLLGRSPLPHRRRLRNRRRQQRCRRSEASGRRREG